MDEVAEGIVSECTIFLDRPPCCLTLSPLHQEYFVAGTYNLITSEETTSGDETRNSAEAIPQSGTQRNGSLVVFKFVLHNIIKLSTIEVPYGVLDINFHGSRLGIATSIGLFTIYEFLIPPTSITPQLIHISTFQISEPETLITSFTWDPSSSGRSICATLTTGEVVLASLPLENTTTDPVGSATTEISLQILFTHSLEAWITVFAPSTWGDSQTQTVFSGGDDAVLSSLASSPHLEHPNSSSIKPPVHPPGHDRPQHDATPSVVGNNWVQNWTNRRMHGAGVTALLPLSIPITGSAETTQSSHVLLTGSYDDTLRVLLVPRESPHTQPQLLHEANMAGGVWRIRLLSLRRESHPSSSRSGMADVGVTLLMSCMYAGAYVVKLVFSVKRDDADSRTDPGTEAVQQLRCTHKILAHFSEHESMCYSCEAHNGVSDETANSGREFDGVEDSTARQIISCSFYDRRICLWRWQE